MSKLYCRILDYLEDKHATIAQVFKDLCAEGFLGPRGKSGVTFLIPSGPVLSQLIKQAGSNDAAQMESALNVLGSLVIPYNIDKASSFVPGMNNAFGLEVPVKASKGEELVFANGATAKLDPKFSSFKKSVLLHVWNLDGAAPIGTVHVDKKKKEEMTKADRARGAKASERAVSKAGGFDPSVGSISGAFDLNEIKEKDHIMRAGVIIDMENAAISAKHAGPMYALACNLLEFVGTKDSNLMQDLLANICCYEFDAYILVEPYRNYTDVDKYLIPQPIFNEWYKAWAHCSASQKLDGSLAKITAAMGRLDANGASARIAMQKDIDNVRQELAESTATGANLGALIMKKYNEWYAKSTVATRSAKLYKAEPMRKLSDDEFRLKSALIFMKLGASFSAEDIEMLKEFFNFVADYFSTYHNETKVGHLIVNSNADLTVSGVIAFMKMFINSCALFFMALGPNEKMPVLCKSLPGNKPEDITGEAVLNLNGSHYSRTGTLTSVSGGW
jgi:hypothetical protein